MSHEVIEVYADSMKKALRDAREKLELGEYANPPRFVGVTELLLVSVKVSKDRDYFTFTFKPLPEVSR